MKKLFSILIAAVLVLGMIPSVFAAGTTPRTITIYNEEAGHTYEAYQVFKGDLVVEYDEFDLTGYTENPTGTWSNGTKTYTVDGTNLKDADGKVVAVQWTPDGGTADWYTAGNDAGGKKGTKTLTNPEWGANLDPTTKVPAGTGKTFAEALADEFASEFSANSVTLDADSTAADVLRALGFITDGAKLADVIAKYVDDTPIATTSTQAGTEGSKYYTLTNANLTDGYYFIKDKDGSLDGDHTESYTDYILKVVEDVSVKAKSDTPSIDKNILETRNVEDGSYLQAKDADGNLLYYATKYYSTQEDADDDTNEITDSAADLTNAIAVSDTTATTTEATNANGLANAKAVNSPDGTLYLLPVKENTASIGEYVQYEITGTIPKMEGYTKYYYMMTDTLSKGLTPVIDGVGTADGATFQNTGANAATMPVTVQIVDADGVVKETITYNADKTSTGKNYYSEINVNADGSHTMKIIFDNFLQYKNYAGCTVVVRYWAQVNNKAIIGNPGNPNEVDLTYSRNPNVEGTPDPENPNNPEKDTTVITGTTPKKIVRTYVTELELLKYDGDTEEPLTGAKFKISGTRYIPVKTIEEVFEADANGTWYLLADGTYTETAPTIDTYEYDGGTVTKVTTGTYASYADYDGTTVYGYETVDALGYTGGFADAADAQAALEAAIKPTHKKVTKVDIEYRTENVDVEVEVDEDGRLLLGGLGAGDYIIEETVAPAGYNMLGKKIELQIRFTTNNNGTNEPADDKFTAQWRFEGDSTWQDLGAMTDPITVAYDTAEQTIDDNYFQLFVPNKKGATVPETGSIGTVIFYVVGTILLVGAGMFLILRRRMAVSKEAE